MDEGILIFDIPTAESSFKVKVNRLLISIGAAQIQKSVWKSNNLKELIRIATLIKMVGGKARIMEEKLIFE